MRTHHRLTTLRVFFLLLLIFLAGGHLTAHSFIRPDVPPVSAATAYAVRRPQVSQVYYTEVDGPESRTWFSFEAEQGDVIHFNAGIPFIERLDGMVVRLALIGPGMSDLASVSFDYGQPGNPDWPEVAGLTAEAASAGGDAPLGAMTFQAGDERRVFHEHFTDTVSWIVVQADVTLPGDGTYYLVIWPVAPLPPQSKLWLAIGVKERFTLYDIFRIGHIIRTVRAFHENPR